jgi:DNA end-binding protein Ku
MARAIWSGSISFGLVNVPVKVYAAVRDHAVHFHQVDKDTGSRIRYQKVAEKTGEPVDDKSLELGYEISDHQLVVMDPDELAALRPGTTQTIDITEFVDLHEVDPVFYQRTYWLAPDGKAAERAYRLLVAALEDRSEVGIGMVVMRNKQYLAAIRPREGALAMSTMRFADEVLARSTVEAIPPSRAEPAANELRLATQIVDSLSDSWEPAKYHDTYTDEVQALVKRHEKGQDVVVEAQSPAAAQANVTDLTQALQASLDAARKAKGKGVTKAIERAAKELAAEGADDGDAEAADTQNRRGKRPSTRSTARRAAASRRSGTRKSA